MPSKTIYEHILVGDDQIPVIAGTRVKVVELMLDHLAYGWSPEELHFQHPHLTMGQIYSSLAYYWDHRSELDDEIERRFQAAERIRRVTPPGSLVKRLRARGRN